MIKHILALSGGMDSAAMLDYLTSKYPTKSILALHCACRAKAAVKEEAAARAMAKRYKVKIRADKEIYRHEKMGRPRYHHTVQPVHDSAYSTLIDKGYAAFKYYEAYNQTDIDNPSIPITYEDHPYHCAVIDIVTKGNVKLVHPFRTIQKSDLILNHPKVPWEQTWSCYEAGEHHCGLCGPCVKRKEAFIIAGVTDPAIPKEKREKWQ